MLGRLWAAAACAGAVLYGAGPAAAAIREVGPGARYPTLAAALAAARGGDEVVLARGHVSESTVITQRFAPAVTVRSADPLRPAELRALEVAGAAGLRFEDLRIAGARVTYHPVLRGGVTAADVTFADNELTTEGGVTCLQLRHGPADVKIVRNWIHDCYTGINGRVDPVRATGVRIERNVMHGFVDDGIQFGAWDGAVIRRNRIGQALDPAGVFHNDAIQLLGATTNTVIADNVLHDAIHLLFVAPSFGTNDDLFVTGNVMHGARGVAVQAHSVRGLEVVHNTIADVVDGGLWLRFQPDVASGGGAVVANNILPTFSGAAAEVFASNLVTGDARLGGSAPAVLPGPPRFVNPQAGDYRLRRASPAAGAATRGYRSGRRDVYGTVRPPAASVGAAEPLPRGLPPAQAVRALLRGMPEGCQALCGGRFPSVGGRVAAAWTVTRRGTAVRQLRVSGLPRGTRLDAVCAPIRGACPFEPVSLVAERGAVTLTEAVPRRLSTGTVLALRLAAPRRQTLVRTFIVRRGRPPVAGDVRHQ